MLIRALVVGVVLVVLMGLLGFAEHDRDLTAVELKIAQLKEKLGKANADLERSDRVLSLLFKDWDRERSIFSRDVVVTMYTSRAEETDDTPYETASGHPVRLGTLAVSRDLLAAVGGFGARVVLVGYGQFVVNDVMAARKRNQVDIWCPDLEAARLHGVRRVRMVWM